VAVALIAFAWKDAALRLPWPPADGPKPVVVVPAQLEWGADVKAKAATMLHTDREYLAKFYGAMEFVLLRDGKRTDPVIKTTDQLVAFHTASLQLAIDQESVGKTPGLGEAVDLVFLKGLGDNANPRILSAEDRQGVIEACRVLAYTFKVGEDG
jgi:hypothetical protein